MQEQGIMPITTDQILMGHFVLDIIFAVAFSLIAVKFYSLRGTVRISIKEMISLIVLISNYKKLENSEEKLALLLKMDSEQLRQEIEKGNLMCLIMAKATGVLETLRSSVPESREFIDPIEQMLDRER